MSNLSLYDITNNFKNLMELDEIDDIQRAEIEKELTELLVQKSVNIIGYIKNIDLTIDAMKTEEKRIVEGRKSLEKKLESFKEYVKNCMDSNSITKVETGLGVLSIRKNPISVEIIDENSIPEEYKEKIETIKINKKAIADNFKSTGELIEGVRINTENTSLMIK